MLIEGCRPAISLRLIPEGVCWIIEIVASSQLVAAVLLVQQKGTSERQLQPMPVRQCQVTVNAQTMKAGMWLPTNKLDKLDKPDKPAALQHSEST